MRVAACHYHLRPGGVTTVMAAGAEALAGVGSVELCAVSGEAPAAPFPSPVLVVPTLCYQSEARGGDGGPEALAAAMGAAAPDAELWHAHNPTLGKHIHLPDALAQLGRSTPLLLQVHDFAEDGRPANLAVLRRARTPYPAAHYAALTRRDRDRLVAAGLPPEFAHVLPNAVALDPAPPPSPGGDPLVFYPVRAIPRKNLGELLLLAAAAPPGVRFAIAAAPDNPDYLAHYARWVAFADERALPVLFGAVGNAAPPGADLRDRSFDGWYAAATHAVTTSTKEGFGMAYLEAAARGRPLLGRDIPDVTADLRAEGLQFGGLYTALRMPDGREFAELDDAEQRAAIATIQDDPPRAGAVAVESGQGVRSLGEWLARVLGRDGAAELAANRRAISARFSLPRYGRELVRLYRCVISEPASEVCIDAERVRALFRRA